MESDSLVNLLRRIGAGPVGETQALGGGRNSQVFRVSCHGGNQYLAKFYYRHPNDSRDRLGNEFRAYELLRSHGLACVPEPLAYDLQSQLALFEYFEGEPVRAETLRWPMIDEAVAFIHSLKLIAQTEKVDNIPPASEACFSVASLLSSIDVRLDSLTESAQIEPSLRQFLDEELLPFRRRVGRWCKEACSRQAWGIDAELDLSLRTLSPSDFGFHNAIRRPNGCLAFVDFEYFGWDDPAKIIADFLLHPAMQLESSHKERFIDRMYRCFASDLSLKERTELLYPLFGLKWCCILLNEFVPHHQTRRRFADKNEASLADVQARQLKKSETLLKQLNHEFQQYPVHS
jgi:phosphotransferase family enzyme